MKIFEKSFNGRRGLDCVEVAHGLERGANAIFDSCRLQSSKAVSRVMEREKRIFAVTPWLLQVGDGYEGLLGGKFRVEK
ncbi:unnamed protein product [Lathyrus oleraceus]